jgi:hypothetical protein
MVLGRRFSRRLHVMRTAKSYTRLLLLMLAVAGVTLMAGCHFHRYHHEHYEYDEEDNHPRYGSHHN